MCEHTNRDPEQQPEESNVTWVEGNPPSTDDPLFSTVFFAFTPDISEAEPHDA